MSLILLGFELEPKDFFNTAEKLKDSNIESDLRTSMSRSYYAIFLYLRDFLASLGLKKKKDNQAHFFVRACLSNSNVKKAQELSALLGDLCKKREKADYKLNECILTAEVDDAYKDAVEAIEDFKITEEDEKKLIKNVKIAGEYQDWFK